MLLVADTTQDIYDRASWTAEPVMAGFGFSGPWTELEGSYRLPLDCIPILSEFAKRFVAGVRLDLPTIPDDHPLLEAAHPPTYRKWVNVDPENQTEAVVSNILDLLELERPVLPGDITVLVEDHHLGFAVFRGLTDHGIDHQHMFAPLGTDGEHPASRRRLKAAFWAGTPGVKGSTVHSFKGWESKALVVAVSDRPNAERLAYVALTRLKGEPRDMRAHVVVINANRKLNAFKDRFEREVGPDEVPQLRGQQRLD